jgi:D-alanyl-lipoteichoic acid acyltransferase DltB (MBOAT superfamily)
MFFPKLVAGPIERAKNLLPQMHARPGFDYAQVVQGLQLATWGAIQKAVIADRIAPFVNRIYDDPSAANGVQVAFATLLYAFQIYADFAGYTNMALGIALLFGYRLTQNFNLPYFAVSIPDFWKRWHISLTSWLTDYVYTPLTRQKKFKIKLFNLMMYSLLTTFIVSGFWHGAAWTYVAWGTLHGIYVVSSLLFQKQRNALAQRIKLTEWPRLHRGIKIGTTFFLVCFAYVLFRAHSMSDAIHMYSVLGTGWSDIGGGLRGVVQWDTNEFLLVLLGITALVGADILRARIDVGAKIMAAPVALRWSVRAAGALIFVVLGAFYSGQAQFIYFRF